MSAKRLLLLAVGIILIIAAWVMISSAQRGLIVRDVSAGGIPMRYMAPADAPAPVPGVVIAHGFAGSKQLMLGYAYTLAHAGYATVVFDFNGHGANPAPLEGRALSANIAAATSQLISQPEVDASRLALIGHSMGSGAVMTAGISELGRYSAVVAISPTAADVRPDAPANLLLMAGSLEPRFVANAESLLAQAGGISDDFAGRRARNLLVVPNAEHITILFRPESQRAALDWIGRTFGTATTTAYTDTRIVWYGLHLVGWLLAVLGLAPLLRSGLGSLNAAPTGRRVAGLLLGGAVATAVVALLPRVARVSGLLGIQVGGAVAVWLLVGGLVWLLFNLPIHRPAPTGILLGVLFLAFLVLAFGVMAQRVWVQWWPIPARLWRWPILSLACLPWFLAAGYSQWGASGWGRLGWALGQAVVFVLGLLITITLAPSLGFLMLLMPILPLIFLILAVAAAAFDRPWPYAIGAAFFFGWMISVVFPLA